MTGRRITILGSGFVASNIAQALRGRFPEATVNLGSRQTTPKVDVTDIETVRSAVKGSDTVINTVGLLQASPQVFDKVQHEGAHNAAQAASENASAYIQISAIGSDVNSRLPYALTKAKGEEAARKECKNATIIRPSLVFGSGDSFFNRFSTLSKYLPFLPVFGDGKTLFQPVYVGDVAQAVAVSASAVEDGQIGERVNGKTIEAGGPEVFTYRQIMELVLNYNGRSRAIIPIPWLVAKMQAGIIERLPVPALLSITRDQVEQLKSNNIVTPQHERGADQASFRELLQDFAGVQPRSVHDVLPTYLSPQGHPARMRSGKEDAERCKEEDKRKKREELKNKSSY